MATAYPTIRQGSTGATVSFLQKNLISLGYGSLLAPHGADGIFGSKTAQAVRDFQTKHALGVDGIVGQKTWDKILYLVPSSDVLVNTIQATIAPPPKKTTAPQTAIAPPPPPKISLPSSTIPSEIKVTESKTDTRVPPDDTTKYALGAAIIAGFYFFVLPKSKRGKKSR